MKKISFTVLLVPLGLLLFSSSPSTSAAADARANTGFIGAITCKDCHERQYETYARSVHFQKSVKGPESQDACETCHGPGASHVEKGGGRRVDIFAFDKAAGHTAEELSAVCLKCHASTDRMTYWDMGEHKKNDVACISCHTIHLQKPAPPDQPTVCFQCHRDIRSDINKLSRHPILEGKVKCSDCHNVHGTMSKGMIKAETVNLLCYTCHADKRGPFIWAHPPVEENCLICHTAHGSRHESLLVDRIPVICQDCHDTGSTGHQSAVYSANNTPTNQRLVGPRACLQCHHTIHGTSNFQRSFTK